MTIHEGSFNLRFRLVIFEACNPMKNKVMRNTACNSGESDLIEKNKGKATIVPKVPGALKNIPEPKPKASKCQKFWNKNFLLTKMRKSFLKFFYQIIVCIE